MRKFIYTLCTILWMALIFNMSGEEGSKSSELSEKVVVVVAAAIAYTTDLDEEHPEIWERVKQDLHYYVRKAAHMLEYAVLGMLLVLMFGSYGISGVIVPWIAILIGVIYAMSDEWHQTFVAGRAGQIKDVLIDSTGLLVGVWVTAFIVGFWHLITGFGRKKKKRK